MVQPLTRIITEYNKSREVLGENLAKKVDKFDNYLSNSAIAVFGTVVSTVLIGGIGAILIERYGSPEMRHMLIEYLNPEESYKIVLYYFLASLGGVTIIPAIASKIGKIRIEKLKEKNPWSRSCIEKYLKVKHYGQGVMYGISRSNRL